MRRIKQWLRDWLGITNLQKTAITNIGEIHNLKQRQLLLESLVEVGVDVHRYGESWAVVCIKGKADWYFSGWS